MWLSDRKITKKIAWVHKIYAAIALAAHMEALTKKLDNLSQTVNIIHQSTPICIDCGTYHITISYPLASIHVTQPRDVSYAHKFQRKQNNIFSNNYNSSWKNYPNLSWSNNQRQGQESNYQNRPLGLRYQQDQ